MALQATSVRTGANRCIRERAEHQARDLACATLPAALNDAIERISSSRYERSCLSRCGAVNVNHRRSCTLERRRLKIEGVSELFPVGAIQAETQAQVQRKFFGHPPIILEIKLEKPVAVGIFRLQIDRLE